MSGSARPALFVAVVAEVSRQRLLRIEGQAVDAREGYGIKTVAPKVVPDSIASCAFTASLSAYS